MTPPPREKIANLPNFLTLLRVLFLPILIGIGLLIQDQADTFPNRVFSFLGGFIILITSVLDVLDGYLARKWGMVTNLGKLFDPMADKLLIMTALVMMIPLDRVPAWMVVLILGREMAVTSLRSFASVEGVIIAASSLGKFKATLQSFAAGFLFLYYPYFSVNWYQVGVVFLWIALLVTLVSGFEYFYRYFRKR